MPHLQDSRWTVDGLTRRLKAEYDVINEIVATAGTKGIPVFEPFAGADIGPFTVLSPPQHIYLGASSGFATAAKQVLAMKAVLSSTVSLADGMPSF